MTNHKKPELLAPAGDFEKLKTAVAYGADAVYLGGRHFSLRTGAGNFDNGGMHEAITYAHARGVKVYVAANIFAFDNDIKNLHGFFKEAAAMGADAFIVSDPGVFRLARREAADTDIHISTQANVTNAESVRFWHDMGAKRIILARELSLAQIRSIRDESPPEIELETFVHGAMCIAFSGRCLLSNYLTGRGANQGACAHPCRYEYYVMEEKRPGQYLPVAEDERGVSIFSSNDLCMIAFLPELISAGVSSFKIEGRMKTSFYTAVTTRTYRRAVDDWFDDPARYEANKPVYIEELRKAAHRGTPGFTTGFYFGNPGPDAQDYSGVPFTRTRVFTGIVTGYDAESGIATIEQRNKFSEGDELEILRVHGESFTQIVRGLQDEHGEPIGSAPHPKQTVRLPLDAPVEPFDMLCQ